MKRRLGLVLVGLVLAGCASLLLAQRPQRSTVTGEVIEIASFVVKDAHGEEHAEAGKFRAGEGFPVGILTEDGDVYIAVYRSSAPASPLKTANETLAELMGKAVVAQGKLFERAGIKVIEIAVVAEM